MFKKLTLNYSKQKFYYTFLTILFNLMQNHTKTKNLIKLKQAAQEISSVECRSLSERKCVHEAL